MVRRETGDRFGRACVRDGSGNDFGGNAYRDQPEVPLPPIVGIGMEVGFKPKSLQRTARRRGGFIKVMGYRL